MIVPDFTYIAAPILGYLVGGSLKFAVNTLRSKRAAFDQIGLGGFPSTHCSVVTSVLFLIAFREGANNAAFSVCLALCIIVSIDAIDLRRRVGQQAAALKDIAPDNPKVQALRDRAGHSVTEVIGGWLVGGAVAYGLFGLWL